MSQLALDLAQVVEDIGSWCLVQAKTEAEARPVYMVVSPAGQGLYSSGMGLMDMTDPAGRRKAASLGYGLLMAPDAPEGMDERTELSITDSLQREWKTDAAALISAPDPETGQLLPVAWRLALYGRQRMGGRQ